MTMLHDNRHEARLRRGRRTWNLMSGTHHGGAVNRLSKPLYALASRHLDLAPGESVLDIGCGSGQMLVPLRAAVGERGRVVGVDYSPRMLAHARNVVRDNGWTNVELRKADASRTSHGHAEFDAAVALASISAMPDVAAAVGFAHDALRPGGRLFVFDMRLVPSGHLLRRTLTRLMRGAYRATAGFAGADVLVELERRFDTVEHVFPVDPTRTRMTLLVARKAA
jgi:ubiquinone/menaquinone biosynthesis C-methylase UbiE